MTELQLALPRLMDGNFGDFFLEIHGNMKSLIKQQAGELACQTDHQDSAMFSVSSNWDQYLV